ncbi:hypothetical protein GDO81_019103 [Engystomops pustulosus]|uniref:Uncharacterized protein n=1 Tax=Engystomops pustulosus TaxID=76066 RepID=A0AAV6YX92_ENGPU|nr:hypothetical protein GDO81_022756 [Engystomops pustulosus]KAG8540538.1 hypothetical protein GDO81_019103 [Engystomops pustulosus]
MSLALKFIFRRSSTTLDLGGHASLPLQRRRTTFLREAPGPVVGKDHTVSPPLFSWKAARPCLSVQKDRSTSLPSTVIDFSPLLRASRRRLCKTLFPEPGDKELTPLAPAVTLA